MFLCNRSINSRAQVTVEIVVILEGQMGIPGAASEQVRKKPFTCIALHAKLALWKVPVLSGTEPTATYSSAT